MAKLKGWKFPIEVNKTTGKIMTVEDDENVKQSIKIILQTEKFERKELPFFGTSLNQFVFGEVGPILLREIREEIENSLTEWEENISDLEVDAIPTETGEVSSVKTGIFYTSKLTNLEDAIIKETNLGAGEKI